MPSIDDLDPSELLYHRLRPTDLPDEPTDGVLKPRPEVFRPLRDNEGWSVFRADMTTPYLVLKHHLDVYGRLLAAATNNKTRDSPKRVLEKCRDVPNMVQNLGWRVCVFPASAFPSSVFMHGPPSEDWDRGHYEIFGTIEAFELNENDARDASLVVSIDECLDGNRRPQR